MLDKLNATKITFILLQEEEENDNTYLISLIDFAIILLDGGNITI